MSQPGQPRELPRIVCTKCLSVVKVHGRMPLPYEDTIVLWIECCGAHKVVSFRGETFITAEASKRDVLVQDQRGDLNTGVVGWARDQLKRVTESAASVGWLLRFFDESGRTGELPVEERLAMNDALVAAAKAIAGPELLERIGIELLEKFQRGAA